MSNLSIIIVGAGIAGLAAAIALRSDDHSITILEASRLNREIGANISLQPNASAIAASWGLEPYLAARGCMRDRAFRIMDLTGEVVMEVANDDSSFAVARNMMHRADLHDALKDRATSERERGRPVHIGPGSRVVHCDCEEGRVTLETGEVLRADVVVAADGIKSVMRNAVLGREVSALPTGFSAYRVLLPTSELGSIDGLPSEFRPEEAVTTMVIGHEKRIVMGPSRNGTVFGVVGLVSDAMLKEGASSTSWTMPGSKDEAIQAYANFPTWIHGILSKAEDTSLWQLRDIDPLPTWTRGRVILIGDSAHAMLPTQGQGASQSFEDAEALGTFLSHMKKSPSLSDVQKTLVEIEGIRKDRATLIQMYSRQQARPGTQGATNNTVTLNPIEFNAFNCRYDGSKDWQSRQQQGTAMPV